MFQTKINQTLALGVEGEYADDSPHREMGYILLSNTIAGSAAVGKLAFAANPADGDTVTISSVVYRFKTTPAQANDIKLGSAVADTIASLEKTINGEGEEGVDYFAGTTTPLTLVTASTSGSTITLTAQENGIEGNSIALASSDANVTVTAFAGGVNEVAYNPTFAHAFTQSTEGDSYAQVGGEGVFAGILVNPKMYANYLNLKPTLTLPNATQGGLCTFGHIFIKSAGAFKIGDIAAYDKTTGKISAYVNADAVPDNAVVIPHARFVRYSGDANSVGILELGD